jgi:diguanylate cyclase (GGDEF)-like protein
MHACLIRWLWCWVLALATTWAAASPTPSASLNLSDRQPEVKAWPAVTLLLDESRALTLADVQQRVAQFQRPTGSESALGSRNEAVWLYIPLRVSDGDGRWVFSVDSEPMHRADVYLLEQGRLVSEQRLGSQQHFAQRPMPTRTHALTLTLQAGHDYELYVRVMTESSLVLPLMLSKPNQFFAYESREQLVQGVITGVALALLVYSLAHWLSLRRAMFGFYALMLACTTVFFADLYGLLQQYVWPERVGLMARISPLSMLMALVASCMFATRALGTAVHMPRIDWGLKALAAASLLAFGVTLVGLVNYHTAQLLTTMLGPPLPILLITASWQRARAGDSAGWPMLMGWACYAVGAVVITGVLRGKLPANYWTIHIFQWGSALEMLAWMRVLGLHIEALRSHAERAEVDKKAMQSLAFTDALTGLPNRRGLSAALERALPVAAGEPGLAVYLVDLDGFKPVNDRLGHDAGDELLAQVGQRLIACMRGQDVVARLGGDEFVILARGISDEQAATALGQKLLQSFLQPFELSGHQFCQVGLTIGFALAPHDGNQAGDLLKRADAAMYAGKQSGRNTVQRGAASPALASPVS